MSHASSLKNRITRRHFVKVGLCASAWTGAALASTSRGSDEVLSAAIIGHTGRGNYGHDLDTIFNGLANVEVTAVADPDATGRAKAAARSGAHRQYSDYREMLEQEKPRLVSVAPRWTDQHHQMALAALKSGAHVILEKPITQTLAEADELLTAAKLCGLKIAVAHQMRLSPEILHLKQCLSEGQIGELLAIHAHGKQDSRAGGEDLIVLGVHLFDLMRFFAGDPTWCSARILQNGHEITLADARPATEGIGLVIGDDIIAEIEFPGNVYGTFTSRARYREEAGPWGLELIGTKGRIRVLADISPRVFVLNKGNWGGEGKKDDWQPLRQGAADRDGTVSAANKRVAEDWLAAISGDREPTCSGYAAMKALEMAMALFAAGVSRGRVTLPLQNRLHPLRPAK